MKRRVIRYLLALGLSISLIVPAAASGDSLISRSYLENTYLPQLSTVIRDRMEASLRPLVNAARSGLDRQPAASSGDWRTALGFTAQTSAAGDAVTLAPGAGLFWTSGTGSLTEGVLIDATAGRVVSVGGALTAGHRYIADGQADVSVSTAAQWLAEGKWMTVAGGGRPAPGGTFTDVPASAWYYDSVKYAYDNGLMNGTSVDGTVFSPNGTTTRGQLVTILWRLSGSQIVDTAASFKDVPDDQFYADAVKWANDNNIVNGYDDTAFGPNDPVTREQMATIFQRYAKYRGKSASGAADALEAFTDKGKVGSWALDAMRWACDSGIITGSADNAGRKTLLPGGSATRAETATMLYRLCETYDLL